jgi:hypothetical protein
MARLIVMRVGARVYYLHTVLHDWPDEKAVAILRNIREAMEVGYSRVLVHETVVGTQPSCLNTTSDMQMMMVLSSFERTEQMWNDLVGSAGLKVSKLWRSPLSPESIIEAVKE